MISKRDFKREVVKWADEIRVNPREIHVRPMKRKWASCSNNGRLSFNNDLQNESKAKRDEVIIHELLHLRYPNHGKMFQRMMRKYLGTNNIL